MDSSGHWKQRSWEYHEKHVIWSPQRLYKILSPHLMKMNREKVQIILTNCEYSPDVLGLYQIGQVLARTPAPNSSCYMQELPNGDPLKLVSTVTSLLFFVTEHPKLAGTHKLKSRGNNSDHVATGTLCIHFPNCCILIYVTRHPA